MTIATYSLTKINTRNLWLGGLAGALPMGITMGMNGFLPTVGRLIGIENVTSGFIVHSFISVMVVALSVTLHLLSSKLGNFSPASCHYSSAFA